MKDCCPISSYYGTRKRRTCRNCGAVEIGSPTRIYFNTDWQALDGEINAKSKTRQ